MQQVADSGGRYAPRALRGLANLARLAGDFPTALAAVPALGWKGRNHRVLGAIHWSQADTAQAVTPPSKPAGPKPSSTAPPASAP
ncbi:hypothetical protein AB0D97_30695 [Streptomyces roseus]|uniref:hypothetical protein n=1 Tax=Streptomyces roseus TaxID=66430 RepID=UPI0033D33A93